jgi:ribosome-associated translation inhibitor RaiA
MHVQVNIGAHIEGRDALVTQARGAVEAELGRVCDHITRVEVHVTDENGPKRGQDDKRCVMEARLEGRQPVAVTHEAATFEQAIDGSAEKLSRLLASTLGRLHDKREHPIGRVPPEPKHTEQA